MTAPDCSIKLTCLAFTYTDGHQEAGPRPSFGGLMQYFVTPSYLLQSKRLDRQRSAQVPDSLPVGL